MKQRFGWVLVGLSLIAVLGVGSASPAASTTKEQLAPPSVPGELIVRYRAGVGEAGRDAALATVAARERREFGALGAELVSVDAADTAQALVRLNDDPRVAYAEPNYLLKADGIPNDASFGQLWGLHNTGQTVDGRAGTPDADIDAVEAWDVAGGSSSTVVAVIDTGIDFAHPDLGGSATASPRMWTNAGESCTGCRTDGIDNDGNGYVDDWRGWDFANRDGDPADDHGHGTHIAGTIGAVGDNGIGVAGINRSGVRLMALKFLDAEGFGTTADGIAAILYAASKGAHVVNASWGGEGYSQATVDALAEADRVGALFVAAAGNDARDNDSQPHYPSSYDVPNVVAVAATNSSDALADFSNIGRESVDLAAPGRPHLLDASGRRLRLVERDVDGHSARGWSGRAAPLGVPLGHRPGDEGAPPARGRRALVAVLDRDPRPAEPRPGRPLRRGGEDVDRVAAARLHRLGRRSRSRSARSGRPARRPGPLTVTANGTAVALTPRGDGLYTGSYVPDATGPLTIAAVRRRRTRRARPARSWTTTASRTGPTPGSTRPPEAPGSRSATTPRPRCRFRSRSASSAPRSRA